MEFLSVYLQHLFSSILTCFMKISRPQRFVPWLTGLKTGDYLLLCRNQVLDKATGEDFSVHGCWSKHPSY